MSDREIRFLVSAVVFFLMGLMGANIVVKIVNQWQNVPMEELRDPSPFGVSEDFFTPEEFRTQEEVYRGRIDGGASTREH
jgi:uracil DNA glycosylase